MNRPRLVLTELREYRSDRTGATYFAGYLGKTRVVMLRDDRAELTGREVACGVYPSINRSRGRSARRWPTTTVVSSRCDQPARRAEPCLRPRPGALRAGAGSPLRRRPRTGGQPNHCAAAASIPDRRFGRTILGSEIAPLGRLRAYRGYTSAACRHRSSGSVRYRWCRQMERSVSGIGRASLQDQGAASFRCPSPIRRRCGGVRRRAPSPREAPSRKPSVWFEVTRRPAGILPDITEHASAAGTVFRICRRRLAC